MLDILAQINGVALTPYIGWIVGFLLLIAFSALIIYETKNPKIKSPKKQLIQSYKTNIGMFVVNTILMSVLSASVLVLIIDPEPLGFLDYIPHTGMRIILSFLLLDLLLYCWHRLCHIYDWLWMFHRVHHNDPCLNVTTAFRVHIVELIITTILKTILIIYAGIDEMIYVVNEFITTVFVMFHHTNIKIKGESKLERVFISPSLHRTHHSVLRTEHDSNYGAVFSIWDQLFGTLIKAEPVAVGIKGESPLNLIDLIQFGFEKSPQPIPVIGGTPVPLNEMIAVAAYYKAEKRGFYPGDDQRDWYDAQREFVDL